MGCPRRLQHPSAKFGSRKAKPPRRERPVPLLESATEVSTVTMRSKLIMIAAVSTNAPSASNRSPRSSTANRPARSWSWPAPGPFCKLTRPTSSILGRDSNCVRRMERWRSLVLFGSPRQAMPILKPFKDANSLPHRRSARSRPADRGSARGRWRCWVVPKTWRACSAAVIPRRDGGSGVTMTNWSIPATAIQQMDERGLALEQHGADAFFDERRITNEVDGVAQALLRVDQDCSPPARGKPSCCAGGRRGTRFDRAEPSGNSYSGQPSWKLP